jgi:hypothetical protein
MIQLIYIVFCIAAVVAAFFSRVAPWIILALPIAHLLFTALAIRLSPKPKHFPELSPRANELLQAWHQYYLMPFAGADFSAASGTLTVTAAAVAVIGLFHLFYLGLALGVVIYFLTA